MKASAIAHPIQGLVKYHGLRDPKRRIPFHDSISVCTGPTHTHTTVETMAGSEDRVAIDGRPAAGRALQRVQDVLAEIRRHAGTEQRVRVESANSFPQYVGLGSSSSGFAALAVAAAAALDWPADLEHLSEVARLGAGSASRAVTGGISEWRVDGDRSYSRCILPADSLEWTIVVPLVRHEEPTENVHAEVVTSPLFDARVAGMASTLDEAHRACAAGDLPRLWALAERDTLNLHAVTMTGARGHIAWRPATVEVIHKVRALRDQGVPVWFSIDTGATAYLNTRPAHANRVAAAVADIPGVAEVLHLAPAGPTRLVDEHLF